MRCHTTSFSSGDINTQLETSITVRPQPRHISSKRVEHTATQGESGLARLVLSGELSEFGGVIGVVGVMGVMIECSVASKTTCTLKNPPFKAGSCTTVGYALVAKLLFLGQLPCQWLPS